MHARIPHPLDPVPFTLQDFAPCRLGAGLSIDQGIGSRMFAPRPEAPQGSDLLARQSFAGRSALAWRGQQPDYNDPTIQRAASIYLKANVVTAAGARTYGLFTGVTGGWEYGIPVPSGKTFKLWYLYAYMEADNTVGTRTLEAGVVQIGSGTYTQIATLAGVTAGNTGGRSMLEATAANYNTPLYSVAGGATVHVALFYGVVAGGAGGTSANGQMVFMNYTLE